MSTCAAAFTSFYSTFLVLPAVYQHVLQRLRLFQHASLINYNMSTCDAAVIPFFSNDHVLPTICQQVLQRLLHFTALVSYYLDYAHMFFSG
jgi:hypothetical protein